MTIFLLVLLQWHLLFALILTGMDDAGSKIIEWEDGCEFVDSKIDKLKRILEAEAVVQVQPYTSEEYMMIYSTIYRMCTQGPPHDYSQRLYEKHKEIIVNYIGSTILPAIRVKHGEPMLRELVRRWSNHKTMVYWIFRFFNFLDRYFIPRRSLMPLKEVSLSCFRDMVYKDVHIEATGAVIELINKEREGELIDHELLKNVLNIFVEISNGSLVCYQQDFEKDFLESTGAYYSHKASSWIPEDSCSDYMLKAEECLRKEKEKASHFLHSSTGPKLVMKVQEEMLVVHANELLENESSGCIALLKDGKVDDLSRMYRLYREIPNGLQSIARIFKQHIILIEQAKSDQQGRERNVRESRNKYMAFVRDCFENHPLFQKAMEEAF